MTSEYTARESVTSESIEQACLQFRTLIEEQLARQERMEQGSAPRMIEDGLGDYANPSSIFKAAEMMLRHIGLTEKADKLASVLTECSETEKKVVVTGFADGATCREFADYVIGKL